MDQQSTPTYISSTLFYLTEGTNPDRHPYHDVTRQSFDGTTTDTLVIATIEYDPHREQYSAMTGAGRTRYVSDPRIAFDDAVNRWIVGNSNPAVEATYKAAATAWKSLAAEEEREKARNEERKADGGDTFPGTRRGLIRAQFSWFTAQWILAKVLESIGEDVEGYKGPSGDRATRFLMKWMENNPNG